MTSTKTTWNYGEQAKYYKFRPNYSEEAIDDLADFVEAKKNSVEYIVADVGAGTGNLTIMLLKRGLQCIAIEPTREMMAEGKAITVEQNVKWMEGTGEHTGLDDNSVDWFTMGSSFNTTDRKNTLIEAHRVLKPGGFFSCMWNHRDLENDPVQRRMEQIIEEVTPGYARGVRREGQADVILSSGLFNDIHYIERSQDVERTLEEYIDAWKSVKNSYWDLKTPEGRTVFQTITDKMKQEFSHLDVLRLTYTTKIWTARVIK